MASQAVRYLLVGGAIGGLWLLMLFVLTRAGAQPWISSAIAFCFCVPLGFLGHRYLTFRSTGRLRTEASRFVAKTLLGFGLSAVVPWLLTGAGYGVLGTAIATPAAVAVAGFLVSRYWVFRAARID